MSWLLLAATGLFVVWLTGQVARDRFWLTGLFFYFPSIVLALFCLGALLLSVKRGDRRSMAFASLLMLPPIGVVLLVENHWVQPRGAADVDAPLRVVHWNVGYGIYGWPGVVRELIRTRADLYVLSEAPRELSPAKIAAQLGPEYSAIGLSSMIAIAKGKLSNPRARFNDRALKAYSFTWASREGPIEILAVDLASNPMLARDPPLSRVAALMMELGPDIVVGDFNALRRSRALTPPPEGFVHAYDAAGGGWSSTWPLPLPLLAIDQCLIGERIQPLRYDLVSTRSSDHREQVLDFFLTEHRRRESPAQ